MRENQISKNILSNLEKYTTTNIKIVNLAKFKGIEKAKNKIIYIYI